MVAIREQSQCPQHRLRLITVFLTIERQRLLAVVRAEARVRREVEAHLGRQGRASVDTLPALREALASGRTLYSVTLDSHPVASGYGVIAETIAAALDARS